jgi:cytochrome c oxidase subunit IV
MTPGIRRLLRSWVLLMVLLALEIGVSLLPFARVARPVILIPAVLMVGVVATAFMDIGRGPGTVRFFAVASLLWLIILLGLGSLDPMTRTIYLVETVQRK